MKTLPLSMLILLLCGCSFQAPQFGAEVNEVRKETGLPVIDSDWVNFNPWNNGSEAAWRTPTPSDHFPRHKGKKIFYESGKWELEQDYYSSGKKGPSSDPDGGTQFENITISYAFESRSGYDLGWNARYTPPSGRSRQVSIQEAENILSTWGLSRLNYTHQIRR